jgi:sigma-E factor negative regulatory protein RseC
MSANTLEHRGIVQSVADGKAIVAMETTGCGSCKQGSSCGIGKLASGRPATLLTLPVSGNVQVGDTVSIALPESRVTVSALLGYFFPAIAMLVGAGFGASFDGSDEATALGAMLGFLGALALARIALWIIPSLLPTPQLVSLSTASNISPISQQEFHHERNTDH